MNILINKLPSEISGNKINSDFRVSIQFEEILLDKNISQTDKIIKALQLYYPELDKISDLEQAVNDMIWFYQCGKEKRKTNKSKKEDKEEKQIYSYEFDSEYIATAFWEQYRIDIWDIEYMHWWKYKSLLDGLSDNTKFSKILEYRAVDLSKIKDSEMKKFYKSMKQVYALPDLRTTEEREADFASAFW